MDNELMEMFKELHNLRQQAKALGIFTGERDILECQNCGLKEDVTFEGLLVTYFGEEVGKDTGLRFIETEDEHIFICPNCGAKVKEDISEEY